MITVQRIELAHAEVQQISVPKGSEILCLQTQLEVIWIWYLCDLSAEVEQRAVYSIGTGSPVPNDGKYLGTAFLMGGELVLHIFIQAKPLPIGDIQ